MHARYVAYMCYRCYGMKTGNFRSVFFLMSQPYASGNVLMLLNVTERELLYEGYCIKLTGTCWITATPHSITPTSPGAASMESVASDTGVGGHSVHWSSVHGPHIVGYHSIGWINQVRAGSGGGWKKNTTVIYSLPQCTCASEVYCSVFVCVSVQ